MVTVILVKVVPTFTTLFEGLGAELPLATRVVIWHQQEDHHRAAVHRRRHRRGPATCSAATTRPPPGVIAWTPRCCALPLVGMIFTQGGRGAVLPHAGHAAELRRADPRRPRDHGQDVRQRHHRRRHPQVRSRIERGETIAAPLRATGIFPPMVVQMIGAGESTGALDTMLGKIADFYEDEVDVAVAGLLTVLEPALICVLGVIVGGIVISMYLPLFDLINQLSSLTTSKRERRRFGRSVGPDSEVSGRRVGETIELVGGFGALASRLLKDGDRSPGRGHGDMGSGRFIRRETNERQDEQGFTLIELLIVVAIISIIAAIAVPGLLARAYDG